MENDHQEEEESYRIILGLSGDNLDYQQEIERQMEGERSDINSVTTLSSILFLI